MARGTENGQQQFPIPQDEGWVRPMRFLGEGALILGVTVLAALLLRLFVIEAFRIPSRSMESALLAGDFVLVNKLAYGIQVPRLPLLSALPLPRFAGFATPARGDVVVFRHSRLAPGTTFVKRCVAGPGDMLTVRGESLLINGTPFPPSALQSSHAASEADRSGTTADLPPRLMILPRRGQTVILTDSSWSRWSASIEAEGHTVTQGDGNRILVDGAQIDSYLFRQNHYFVLGDNLGDSRDSRTWGPLPEEDIIGKAIMVYWSRDEEPADGTPGASLASIRWLRIGTIVR